MQTKLRAVIIDDCPGSRQLLINFLDKLCKEDVDVEGTGECYRTGVEIIKKMRPDIVFLNVEMPGGDGFDVLSALDNKDFSLIFTSGFTKYSIEAIKEGALYYLVKPIDIDELIHAVQKAKIDKVKREILSKNNGNNTFKNGAPPKIIIDQKQGSSILPSAQILYCSSKHKYTMFHLADNEIIPVRKNLAEFEPVLIANGFVRISRSAIVNSVYIRRYQIVPDTHKGAITLSNNEVLVVSTSRYSDVKRIFKNKDI